jgi:hypothetical protein
MTHAEFRATRRATTPLEPTSCPGELEPIGRHELADGRVDVFRCRECGRTVSYDPDAGLVLNDYPDPRRP